MSVSLLFSIEIWAIPPQYLVLLQELSGYLCWVARNAILHEDSAAMDVHVQFQLLFEQFHLGPFLVGLGRMKYRPAAPWHDMAPQIIWLCRCFIVATTHFLSKHSPNGRLMCMWRGTNCCMVHSSEYNTFFLLARVQCE